MLGNGGVEAVLSLGTHAIADDSGHTVRDSKPALATVAARSYLLDVAVGDALPAADRRRRAVTYTLGGPGTATTLLASRRPFLGRRHAHALGHTDERDGGGVLHADRHRHRRRHGDGVLRPLGGDGPGGHRRRHHLQPGVGRRLRRRRDDHGRRDLRPGADRHRRAATGHRRRRTTRQAAGSHTAGESKIAFSYTVATADRDADGIAIAAGALTLNGATVRNARARTRGWASVPTPSPTPRRTRSPPRPGSPR